MNHDTLKQLLLSNQRSDHRMISFMAESPDGTIIMNLHYGAKVISKDDKSWNLEVQPEHLSGPIVDMINLITPPDFVIKKSKPRVFTFNGTDYLGKNSAFRFNSDGTWDITGEYIDGSQIKEKTKELHKLTRRIRKKVQPQLRLLGPKAFRYDRDNRYTLRQQGNEIDILMNLLDGKDVKKNLTAAMHVCDMTSYFGQGSWYGRNTTSDFKPKAIIDKILRRVSANKLAILEKYDERNRKTTNRPKVDTRRAA